MIFHAFKGEDEGSGTVFRLNINLIKRNTHKYYGPVMCRFLDIRIITY